MNFPAGKRNRKWDPSEDWYRGIALLEVLEPTALPVAAHMHHACRVLGKEPMEQEKHWHRAGPFTPGTPATRSRGGDSCLCPAGEVGGALPVVCGMLDPE